MYVQCGCAIFIRTWISTENGRVHGLWHQWWVKHFRWLLNSWLFDSCTAALCENLFFKQHLYTNRCLNFQTEFWILGGVNSSWFYSLYSGVYLIELAWSYWLWIILESAELCHTPLASLSSVTVFLWMNRLNTRSEGNSAVIVRLFAPMQYNELIGRCSVNQYISLLKKLSKYQTIDWDCAVFVYFRALRCVFRLYPAQTVLAL